MERYTYDAFGRPRIMDWAENERSESAVGNRFMFQGREWIAELGIYDYRHRMYKPELGRFLQTDPTGFDAGDMNLFRYCDDDPVDKSDPTGLYETPLGGWDVIGSGKSASYEMDAYRNSLTAQPAGLIVAQLSRENEGEKDGRSLTQGEMKEARAVFGKKIHYSDVRVIDGKANIFQSSRYAVTIGNHIYWPHASKDFSKLTGAERYQINRFIHEMTHVMQYQHGRNVVLKAIPLQAADILTHHLYNPYRGGAYDGRRPFSSYNVEQQGDIAARIYQGELQKTIIDYPDFR